MLINRLFEDRPTGFTSVAHRVMKTAETEPCLICDNETPWFEYRLGVFVCSEECLEEVQEQASLLTKALEDARGVRG